MPVQTTVTGNIYFPDGAKVQVKESGAGTYTDIGAINSPINCTLEYTENQINTANAGRTALQIRDMIINGSFTLINLNPEYIEKLSGGMMSHTATAGTTVVDADITDQSISGYTAGVTQDLVPVITATGVTLRFSDTPVITSVTGSTSGALSADDDYFIVADSNSVSGYTILFNGSGTNTPGTGETYTVDFGDNDPVASDTIYAGTSTSTLSAYALKFTHTDSDGLDRELELFSVNPTSGGFQFNFKGANEDGLEEMPITFRGDLDTSRTDGQQLLAWTIEDGAA